MRTLTDKLSQFRFVLPALLIVLGSMFFLLACQQEDDHATSDGHESHTLNIYSGRSEKLVGPFIEMFKAATGLEVNVKYAGTSELAVTLQEEGENSPADLFWAQEPGGLGAIESQLKVLPSSLTLNIPIWAKSSEGKWVGITGRARTVVYNTDNVTESELTKDLMELTDSKWKNRVGWAPTNASFQVMVTAMRKLLGEEETSNWLKAMAANGAKIYPKNSPQIIAAASGEIDLGLVNHYYLHRKLATEGESYPARNHHLGSDGPGSLIMVSGVGILKTSNNPVAEQFVEYLLSKEVQQRFATETYEYPVVPGVETNELVTPIEMIKNPSIEVADLSDLEGTLRLLRDTGVLP